jgi:hypothetical protein
MKRALGSALFISFILVVDLTAGIQAVVDFESLPAGKTWGSSATPSTPPGTLLFSDSGIDVSINEFQLPGAGKSYGFAKIDLAGTGQNMRLNNVVMTLDFARLPRPVRNITIEYVDLGGSANIAVNGNPPLSGALSTLPSTVAPNVFLLVTRTPVTGGVHGKIILLGPITSLTIGGQEFWIDNVTVRDCE